MSDDLLFKKLAESGSETAFLQKVFSSYWKIPKKRGIFVVFSSGFWLFLDGIRLFVGFLQKGIAFGMGFAWWISLYDAIWALAERGRVSIADPDQNRLAGHLRAIAGHS